MSMESWIEGYEAFKSILPTANISGGTTNQLLIQTAPGVTGFVPAPNVDNTFLKWDGSSFTFDVSTGLPGTRTAVLDVYKWSTSAPTTFPSGTSTYTWGTAQFTAPTTANGWALVPPAPVSGQTLWLCRQVYVDNTTSSTATVTWAATTSAPIGYAGASGDPSIVIDLDNDASQIPADSSGVVPSSFTGATTNAKVYIGSVDDSANWSFSVSATSGLTVTYANGNKTATVTNMASNLDYGEVIFTATKSGKPTQTIVFSVTKVKSGASGGNTTLYALSLSSGAINRKVDGTLNPSSLIISATQTSGASGSTSYSGRFKIYTQASAGGVWSAVYTSVSNESSTTYSAPTSGVVALKVELYLAGGTATLLDTEVIPYLIDGANGSRTAYLEMYQWSTSVPTLFPSGTSTYTFSSGSFTAPSSPNGWSVSPGASSAGQSLYACSVIYTDTLTTNSVSVTWPSSNTASIVGANGTNGLNGVNGKNSVVVQIYQRAASSPALPTATSTYSFVTNTLSDLSGGWSTTIPAGTDPIYVSAATASSTGSLDTIESNEWATPVVFAQNIKGDPGASGLNTATVPLYKRTSTATAPDVPSADITYTFGNGIASDITNGWSQSMPTTGGSYRWMTTATAINTATQDTIKSGEWSSVALVAQDGTDGTNGATGGPGPSGVRGPFRSKVTVASAAWSDSAANTAILNMANSGGYLVVADEIVQAYPDFTNPTWVMSKSITALNSSTSGVWTATGQVISGDLIVTGAITTSKIVAGAVDTLQVAQNAITRLYSGTNADIVWTTVSPAIDSTICSISSVNVPANSSGVLLTYNYQYYNYAGAAKNISYYFSRDGQMIAGLGVSPIKTHTGASASVNPASITFFDSGATAGNHSYEIKVCFSWDTSSSTTGGRVSSQLLTAVAFSR